MMEKIVVVMFRFLSLDMMMSVSAATPSPSTCPMDLFGIGFEQYLKQTSQFNLQDLQTSISCICMIFNQSSILYHFQTTLSTLSLTLISLLSPLTFVQVLKLSIIWNEKLGQNTNFNTVCKARSNSSFPV
jgi:hypothetical protein